MKILFGIIAFISLISMIWYGGWVSPDVVNNTQAMTDGFFMIAALLCIIIFKKDK